MPFLDSVRLKIGRAKEHAELLEAELTRYFDGKPCQIVAKYDKNGNLFCKLVVSVPIPDKISLIIGDSLQSIRSALDYLVWELALAAKTEPGEKHAFPVCATHKAFKDEIRRGRLSGLPEAMIAKIEALQPYHRGENWEASVLWVLNQFTNINKHRRILLTVLDPFFTKDPAFAIPGPVKTKRVGGRAEQQAQAGITEVRDGQMYMDSYAAVCVVFGEGKVEGWDVNTVLADIIDWIEKALIRFV